MRHTTTLFLMNGDTPDAVVTELAEAAAQKQTHLGCLIIDAGPDLPATAYGIPPYGAWTIPDDWGTRLEDAHQEQNKRVQEVEQLLARANTSGDVQSAFCVASEIKYHVGRKARVSDVALIAPNMREAKGEWREASHGVLFHSPIGLIVNGTGRPKPERVFVAWDSSKASSRAVHTALPILKGAKEVMIGCFDPVTTAGADGEDPGTGLAAWLSHHGCNVTVSQFPGGGKEIAQGIEDRAKEFGADLVVMGAYGHARMLQAVFGGTTQSMIEQTDLPVLLAH